MAEGNSSVFIMGDQLSPDVSLLAGIDPQELYRWTMMTNIDACERAAAIDAICLSRYADGGKVAMKPYVPSAAFIHSYSDYCQGCDYSWRKKTREGACPFNYPYWDFIGKAKPYEVKTCRLTIPGRAFDRAEPAVKAAYEKESASFLGMIEDGKAE